MCSVVDQSLCSSLSFDSVLLFSGSCSGIYSSVLLARCEASLERKNTPMIVGRTHIHKHAYSEVHGTSGYFCDINLDKFHILWQTLFGSFSFLLVYLIFYSYFFQENCKYVVLSSSYQKNICKAFTFFFLVNTVPVQLPNFIKTNLFTTSGGSSNSF